jgi:hypothetical protein
VPPEQIAAVIDHGTRQPATGVMAFHWSGISQNWTKADALRSAYRAIQPSGG